MVDVTDFKNDPLEKEGWQRRSILDESRLSEVVKMYEDMGLEVLVTEIDPELIDAPQSCIESVGEFKVVYTRPKKEAKEKDELFD